MSGRLVLYSAVDAALTRYEVDAATASLARRETVRLPAKVQYVWPHPARPVVYATSSSSGPRTASADNAVSALAVGPGGTLAPLGEPGRLPRRGVHLCVDPAGRFLVNGHNFQGGGVSVHALDDDGRITQAVAQPDGLDFGIYPHQVRVFPSGRTVLVVDRGIDAQAGRGEQPGALRSFGVADGVLSAGQVIAPGGGFGFGPRHVDFHPTRRWLYVSDERTNRLHFFRFDAHDRLDEVPACSLPTLGAGEGGRPRQLAGPIHVHPSGRFVYVANRGDLTREQAGRQVFAEGDNTIAVYAIDEETGVPRLLQHAPTHAFHVRTFSIDPSGRLLVAGSIKPMDVAADAGLRRVPASLNALRIQEDGTLAFASTLAVETGEGELQYWTGLVEAPAPA